eukprot:6477279-Amphidinium_carterae.1
MLLPLSSVLQKLCVHALVAAVAGWTSGSFRQGWPSSTTLTERPQIAPRMWHGDWCAPLGLQAARCWDGCGNKTGCDHCSHLPVTRDTSKVKFRVGGSHAQRCLAGPQDCPL